MSMTVKNSKMARRYEEEFKGQAVELLLHGGKTQRQVARELDISDYSLSLWKKAYLGCSLAAAEGWNNDSWELSPDPEKNRRRGRPKAALT